MLKDKYTQSILVQSLDLIRKTKYSIKQCKKVENKTLAKMCLIWSNSNKKAISKTNKMQKKRQLRLIWTQYRTKEMTRNMYVKT